MEKRDRQFNLIPYHFKFIGLEVVILSVLLIVAIKKDLFTIRQEHKEFVKNCGINFFLLGLLFIALAKDKVEDEITLLLKTKAFASGFVGAVFSAIIWSVGNMLFGTSFLPLTGQGLAMLMLFTYLATYYIQKLTDKA